MPAQINPYTPYAVRLGSITFRSRGSSVNVVTTLRDGGVSNADKKTAADLLPKSRDSIWGSPCVIFNV